MVDYETYCRIRDHLGRQQLTVAQTAGALGLDARTVARWAEVEQFRARKATPRASKLDAFKGQIVRWLDAHPYSPGGHPNSPTHGHLKFPHPDRASMRR